VKKVSVIGWSVGLAVVLILITQVVILSGTKASARFTHISAETRETSIEEPTDKDVALWTSKSMRIGLETVVESEREADDTTNEGPQDDSNK
jgi:hypothetical protein